jgi:hypothetical protein
MKVAVEHYFNGVTEPTTGTYNSSKTMIASLLEQVTGVNPSDKYIAPKSVAAQNIVELFSSGSQFMPFVYKWSNNIYWIFSASNATATVTRTLALTEFNSTTKTLTYKGFITLSGTTILGNKTVRSLRSMVYTHTTGTVSTSGSSTTITGLNTLFQDERIAVGARIGFGTTDPTAVTTWYEISAINSNTSLTISAPVTLAAETPYVIEEIRVAVACSNVTAINGGIHLIKGLNYGTFTQGGTTIPEATTVDNIRASYLLTDAEIAGAPTATFTVTIATPAVFTVTGHGLNNGDVVVLTTTGALPTGLTASATTATQYFVVNASTDTFNLSTTLGGAAIATSGSQSGTHTIHSQAKNVASTIALDEQASTTRHDCYFIATYGTSCSITRYNLRASLTVGAMGALPNISAGTSPSAYNFKTGTVAVTGTPSTVNGGRFFTVNHGNAAGSDSLYFTTTTRIYRVPITDIVDGSFAWIADSMLEIPPGSSTTYSLTNNMQQVDYSETIDRIFITTGTARFGTYVGTYSADPFEKYVGASLNRLKLTTTPAGTVDGLFPQAAITLWTTDGWMFVMPAVVTTGLNWLYVFPFGADATYNATTNQHVITPKLATTDATKLYKVYVDHMEYGGTEELGFPVESYKLWYRTSGIDDNSGQWVEIESTTQGLENVSPSDYIQFKIAFDILGEISAPTRIYSIAVTYEDSSQDSRYQPSLGKSSTASKIFAWQQVSPWNSNIPNLRIRLYDASTNVELLNDTVTLSSYGTWQYSTNGTTWNTWSSAQDAVGNFIRYTATNFGYSGVTVRALLTQA